MHPLLKHCLPFVLAAIPSLAAAESLERLREDFLKLKFGMFIHFNMGNRESIKCQPAPYP